MSIQYGGIGGAGEGSIWQLVALAAAAALAVRWLSKKL
jgi:hypothetical protein